MGRVHIKPAWVLHGADGDHFEPKLFRLLAVVRDSGRLTVAARSVGLSYRHAWHLLAKWATLFGSDLVAMEQGKGTRLTRLGERLLWVEQRTDASLYPQLENIASELNLEIRRARRAPVPMVRIHASHGYAIERLPGLLQGHPQADVALKYVGSVEALASLARGTCDLAGFHVPIGELALPFWNQYAGSIHPRQQRVIRMVRRTQGLIVAPGNPLRLRELADLARPRVTFVNRQPGSGTRVLFDALLAARHLSARAIRGYESAEITHAAVAATVASGAAHAGLGVEAAARAYKLDFIPLVEERYLLACRHAALSTAPVLAIVALLRGSTFRHAIGTVPGYRLDRPGEVSTFARLFPDAFEARRMRSRGNHDGHAQSPD